MRSRLALASLLGAGFALVISLSCPAVEAPSKEKIDKLIEQMGSSNFAEREKATKELAAIGVPALEALRKAAKGDDAEVRKRAEELLPKIERQADSARVLAPKRVRLAYKDTPIKEALADFQKQSGYSMDLHDPDGKLKDRKITLDTGDATFWHAFDLFCAKAELMEASLEDLMQPQRLQPGGAPAQPGLPGLNPVAFRPGRVMMPGMPARNAQFLLKDGKPKKLPTDDRGAIRIRASTKSDLIGTAPEGEILLPLEVTPEPKLQWEFSQSIHIDKALDDRDQNLTQVVPQVEGVAGAAGVPANQPIQMRMQMQKQRQMMQMRMRGGAFNPMGGNLSQQVPVQFKKGAKEAKSLKELKGTITAQVLTEAQPMIVADKLKAGESVKGKEGGFIKIVDVKSEEKEATIRLEFEQPPFDKVMPAQQNFMQGFVGAGMAPVRIQVAPGNRKMPPPPPPGLAAKPQAAPPAPPALQGNIVIQGRGFGGAAAFMDSFNGLSVRDGKDNTLPIQVEMENRFQQQRGGGFKQTTTYTLTCRRDKEKGEPAKIVFLGRKRATVEIPFALTDVPLP